MSGKFRACTVLACCCLLVCLSAFGQSVQSDESGTLIALGMYGKLGFVAIDSQVHATGGNAQENEVNWERKLVLIGQFGACATDGWEGMQSRGIKLSDDLWKWSYLHPNAHVQESLRPLLEILQMDWQKAHYAIEGLPTHRHIGSYITGLYCVGTSSGRTRLFVGTTKVGQDGTAEIDSVGETNEPLTISGVLSTADFVNLITHPNLAGQGSQNEPQMGEMDRKFVSIFRSDLPAMTAFKRWESSAQSPPASAVEDLTKALYRDSEQAYPGIIASPNILILSGPDGRVKTNVEAKWPTTTRRLR